MRAAEGVDPDPPLTDTRPTTPTSPSTSSPQFVFVRFTHAFAWLPCENRA